MVDIPVPLAEISNRMELPRVAAKHSSETSVPSKTGHPEAASSLPPSRRTNIVPLPSILNKNSNRLRIEANAAAAAASSAAPLSGIAAKPKSDIPAEPPATEKPHVPSAPVSLPAIIATSNGAQLISSDALQRVLSIAQSKGLVLRTEPAPSPAPATAAALPSTPTTPTPPPPPPPPPAAATPAAAGKRGSKPTVTAKRKSKEEEEAEPECPKGSRFDTSLVKVTKKFLDLARQNGSLTMDLNVASETLGVKKRRIYDITNVMEGIGIIEKQSKNIIQWKCPSLLTGETEVGGAAPMPIEDTVEDERIVALRAEIEALQKQDRELEEQNRQQRLRLRAILEDPTESQYAYLTHEDILRLHGTQGEALIVVRAPAQTSLSVPDPDEGMEPGKRRFQIFLKSQAGPIECWLIPQPSEDQRYEEVPPAPAEPLPAQPPSTPVGRFPGSPTSIKSSLKSPLKSPLSKPPIEPFDSSSFLYPFGDIGISDMFDGSVDIMLT